jgi:hypothetical protein
VHCQIMLLWVERHSRAGGNLVCDALDSSLCGNDEVPFIRYKSGPRTSFLTSGELPCLDFDIA